MKTSHPVTHTWPDVAITVDAVAWLIARHPQLAGLVERIPGAVQIDDGRAYANIEAVGREIHDYDHGDNFPSPLGVMSPSERTRLRMLATFSGAGSRLSVCDLWALDDDGRRLADDWIAAVRVVGGIRKVARSRADDPVRPA